MTRIRKGREMQADTTITSGIKAYPYPVNMYIVHKSTSKGAVS